MKKIGVRGLVWVLGLASGLAVWAEEASVIELPLTGPAYLLADEAYKAYDQGDFQLATEKAREAIRLRPDVARLKDVLNTAQTALRALGKPTRMTPMATQSASPRPSQRPAPPPPEDRAFSSADAAYKAYDQGEHELAIRHAKDAVRRAPSNASYWLLLVNALMAAQQFEEADQALSEAAAQAGSSQELLALRTTLQQARATLAAAAVHGALERGDVDAAMDLARQSVADAADMESSRLVLAEALLRGEQWDEAVQVASDVHVLNKDDPAPLVLRAYARQRLGQTAAAMLDFDQAMSKSNATVGAQRNVHLIATDAALAARDPQRALNILAVFGQVEDDAIVRRRVTATRMLSYSQVSSKSMATAHKYPPPAIDCTLQAQRQVCSVAPGQIPRDRGFDLAVQAYKALDAKDHDTTVVKISEAIRLAPGNQSYQLLLVNTLLAANRLEEAEQAASTALAMDDEDAELLAQRGQIRQRLGRQLLAEADFAAALRFGGLPLKLEVALLSDTGRKQEALQKFTNGFDTGAFNHVADLEIAYLATRVGDDEKALAAFALADRDGKLVATALADAAFSAIRQGRDGEAVSYFKRTIDAADALQLRMDPQLVFETRRALETVSRTSGVMASFSHRGAGSAASSGTRPDTPDSGGLQAGLEVYWRPFGYQNGQTVEVFGRVFETLQDRAGGLTGSATVQGTVGARWKPLTSQNLVLSLGRLVKIGSDSSSDWLVQTAYSAGKGTDFRVDVPSWWTAQGYGEVGRYVQRQQTYGVASAQFGRSIRFDQASAKMVLFPHLTMNADYNSLNAEKTAVGMGPGLNFRYWFNDDFYTAPRSFVDLTMQYRFRLEGDERAQGVFMTTSISY